MHGKDKHQVHDNGFSRGERGGSVKGVPGASIVAVMSKSHVA